MPAAPSQSRIINAAAGLLGSTEEVQHIRDGSRLAKLADKHWDDMLRMLVAEHPWNAFITRADLNESVELVDREYRYRFALPVDCLRWLPPGPSASHRDFRAVREGSDLLTDTAAPLTIRYISAKLVDEVPRWSPHFVTTMTDHLASAMAEALTGSQSIHRTMMQRAMDSLATAKRRDGLESNGEQRVPVHRRSRWSRAKFSGGYPRPPYWYD